MGFQRSHRHPYDFRKGCQLVRVEMVMKINFRSLDNKVSDTQLKKHFQWLTTSPFDVDGNPGRIAVHATPRGYEHYHTVDVIGPALIWMNETFPKEKFTWYLWFESVFLVPEEMMPFILLKWS